MPKEIVPESLSQDFSILKGNDMHIGSRHIEILVPSFTVMVMPPEYTQPHLRQCQEHSHVSDVDYLREDPKMEIISRIRDKEK